MKKLRISIFLILAGTVYLAAQVSTLPVEIRTPFQNKFPNARSVDWYMENDNYILEFDLASNSYAVSYTSEGKWIETGIVISDMEIPDAVKSAINQKCPKNIISYTEKMENAAAQNFFRVHCYNSEADFVFNINPDGKLLNFSQTEKFVIDDEPEDSISFE